MVGTLSFNGRLPGIAITPVLPQAGANPLRLDVAGFVGFAERGPYHTPVMVEDMDQYRAIFGGDFMIARDGGVPVFANLPKAVQAFFDNGGRRCYVVQVGGDNSGLPGSRPSYNFFTIPGLMQFTAAGENPPASFGQPVKVPASWPGRWSDKLSVATQVWPKLVAVPQLGRGKESTPRGQYRAYRRVSSNPQDLRVAVDLAVTDLHYIRKGDLLLLQFERGEPGKSYFFPVEEEVELAIPLPGSVSIPQGTIPVTARTGLKTALPPDNADLGPLKSAQLLTFDILIREGISGGESWIKLQFGPGPDYWVDRLAQPLDEGTAYTSDIIANRSLLLGAPPEAARVPHTVNANRPFYFPVTADPATGGPGAKPMSQVLPSGDSFRFRDPDQEASDGLATYNPVNWFIDPGFIERMPDSSYRVTPVRDLLDRADQIEYGNWMDRATPNPLALSQTTRKLKGLHSLLRVSEVALIALPDACHRNWTLPEPLPGERERRIAQDEAEFHTCVSRKRILRKAHDRSLSAGDSQEGNGDFPALNVLPVMEPPEKYNISEIQARVEELLALLEESRLRIHRIVLAATALLESITGPNDILPELKTALETALEGYKKNRRLTPELLAPVATALESTPVFEDSPFQKLITIQQALINLCAARADAVAVLTLPRHFQKSDVLYWRQNLVLNQTRSPGVTALDGAALGYAAVYHPWLQVRETAAPQYSLIRSIAPDGVVLGMIAARELARGAWIAPANLALTGVIGLEPGLEVTEATGSADPALDLFNAQVNILRPRAGEFSALSAHTLSLDRNYLQLSVRRLLIYLRKMALFFGMQHVFEPNNEVLRAQVQNTFEAALKNVLTQGGISAYQVITQAGVINSDSDRDNGRFFVILKIAPTTPVEFITVTLMRSDTNTLTLVEG